MRAHDEPLIVVDPVDPAAIADALADVLTNDPLRRCLSAAARTTALNRFHPRKVAERTLKVYVQATRSRRPGRYVL